MRSLSPREALDQGSVLRAPAKENQKATGLATWQSPPCPQKNPQAASHLPAPTKPTPKTHPFRIFQWHRILSGSNRELSLRRWWPTTTASYFNTMRKRRELNFQQKSLNRAEQMKATASETPPHGDSVSNLPSSVHGPTPALKPRLSLCLVVLVLPT